MIQWAFDSIYIRRQGNEEPKVQYSTKNGRVNGEKKEKKEKKSERGFVRCPTFCGIVAENMSVCRCALKCDQISLTSSSKPRSTMRSASSKQMNLFLWGRGGRYWLFFLNGKVVRY